MTTSRTCRILESTHFGMGMCQWVGLVAAMLSLSAHQARSETTQLTIYRSGCPVDAMGRYATVSVRVCKQRSRLQDHAAQLHRHHEPRHGRCSWGRIFRVPARRNAPVLDCPQESARSQAVREERSGSMPPRLDLSPVHERAAAPDPRQLQHAFACTCFSAVTWYSMLQRVVPC